MSPPSTSQLALLIICGTLLATFSCFYSLETQSVPGALGIVVGAVLFAYAGVRLIVDGRQRLTFREPPPDQATAPPPERQRWTFHEPAGDESPVTPPSAGSSRPTAGQGCLLGISGALLFFFTCSGAFLDYANFGGLAFVAIIGTITGTVFMVWGLVRLVKALWRLVKSAGE